MTHPADVLAIEGMVRPDDVVTIAAAAGLELAAACALIQMETGTGRNIFGHDGVPTGNAYVKGGEVTEATYAAYKAWRDGVPLGRGRCQGVGPVQLTAWDFQEQADHLGGCWRWEISLKVGFTVLAGYVSRYGLRSAYVAYNGGVGALTNGNEAARSYGALAMTRYAAWQRRLSGAVSTTSPLPVIQEDDMPYSPEDLTKIVRDAVWGTLLPDHYRAEGETTDRAPFAAGDMLAWATAHAAYAREFSGTAVDWVRHVAQTAAAAAPEIDYQALARELLDGLAERRAA